MVWYWLTDALGELGKSNRVPASMGAESKASLAVSFVLRGCIWVWWMLGMVLRKQPDWCEAPKSLGQQPSLPNLPFA